jgi:hypothetical protein
VLVLRDEGDVPVRGGGGIGRFAQPDKIQFVSGLPNR